MVGGASQVLLLQKGGPEKVFTLAEILESFEVVLLQEFKLC